ncbi:MAG: hypothetical protein BGO49_31145 [Planctomycetales bacterium 71-10]|nr:MAG: hypothetical protein BGO49_31145 [Planctomycetales bacterium 71-10]
MDDDPIGGEAGPLVDDPAFFLLAAASLVVVLFFLHRGGWRLLTHLALAVVETAFDLARVAVGFLALLLYAASAFGSPESRPDRLALAVVLTAAWLGLTYLLCGDHRLGRLADKLRIR